MLTQVSITLRSWLRAGVSASEPKKPGSPIMPYFITSAQPQRYSSSGRVARVSVSQMTREG